MEKKKRKSKNEKSKSLEHVEKFVCKMCNYECSHRGNYNKHLRSKKHLTLVSSKNVEKNAILDENVFYCECGKFYRHRQSLYSHERRGKYVCSKEDDIKSETPT